MNDIVYLTKRFETISIKTKHYPGRGSIEEIATLIDWKVGNAVSNYKASVLIIERSRPAVRKDRPEEGNRRRTFFLSSQTQK